uniref:F-box protein n=1 Tax=Rodentolepis nana TaxID=102285 RepID=A0A0R3T2G3_RODNA
LKKFCLGYTIPLIGKWGLSDGKVDISFNLDSIFGTDIYSVLQTRGFIPNPLTGYGDIELRPLSYGNWTYSHYIHLGYKDILKTIFLELDQIDSYCCVYLNYRLLICTDSSFIRYSVPISPYTRHGWNFLQLKFNSTPIMARSAYQKLAPNPPPPRCWPSVFNGECFINAVRTTQASFGWDWGPAFPIQGFWKTPSLRFNVVWLGDGVQFFPTLEGTTWRAAVSVEIIGGKPNSKVCVSVKLGGGLMKNFEKRCIRNERNSTDVWMELPLNGNSSVIPWWPIGVHSGPKVYSLMVQLRDVWGGYLYDSRLFRVGFRQVELIQVNFQNYF